jgi:uncharacterized membrane protein YphA (DoxX/SURF4 family)
MDHTLGLLAAQLACSAFLAILFLQSGLDKLFDYAGNRAYIAGYLEKSPLKAFTGLLFFVITALEVLAGAASAAGFLLIVPTQSTAVAFLGAILSTLSVLSLFVGQRMAKDYAAAAGMVGYFLVCALSLLVLGFMH